VCKIAQTQWNLDGAFYQLGQGPNENLTSIGRHRAASLIQVCLGKRSTGLTSRSSPAQSTHPPETGARPPIRRSVSSPTPNSELQLGARRCAGFLQRAHQQRRFLIYVRALACVTRLRTPQTQILYLTDVRSSPSGIQRRSYSQSRATSSVERNRASSRLKKNGHALETPVKKSTVGTVPATNRVGWG